MAIGTTGLAIEDVLDTAPFRQARPQVLVPGERRVSWVHSSEIYEIAPLLEGGEVLLTTGLGLVGADDAALARYAEGIAERGAAALALELGRTFVQVPEVLVDACARSGLGLVVLHAVVPFVRLARTANERILDHEADTLRRTTALAHALSGTLLRRRGLQAIVAELSAHAGTPLQLVDLDGKVHAGPPELTGPTLSLDVELTGGRWGRLVAADSGDPHLRTLLMPGVDALRLALADLGGVERRDAARALLLDLVHGPVDDLEDLSRRAAALRVPVDQPVAALVVVPAPGLAFETAVAAVGRAARSLVRTDLVAASDDGVLAVVHADAARRTVAERLLAATQAELAREAGRVRHLAVGTAVARLDEVSSSFGVALLAASTARRVGSDRRLLLPMDLALERLLLDSDDAVLERLVTRVLGPLLQHDATRRAPLLPTLLAYLASGRSKAATAARLGVRRQTVHDRLDRIAAMLDLPDDDPAATTVLEVAARAWEVRTAGVGGEQDPADVTPDRAK